MNNTFLRRLISAAAAGAVCLSLLGFSAAAAGKGAAADEPVPSANVLQIGDVTAYLVGAPARTECDSGAAAVSESSSSGGDDFLARCRGIDWGYGYLDNFPNPQAAKSLYNELYNFSAALWNNPNDYAGELVEYTDLADNVHKSMRVLGMVKPKVSMSYSDETATTVSRVYYLFRHDHPEFYFCGMTILSYNSGQVAIIIEDEGYLKGAKRTEYGNAVKNYVKSSEALVHNDYTRTDYQNALELYKKVMNGMSYAKVNGAASSEPFAHNILGGIIEKSGVCESYAKIFSMLMNYHGIDNVYVGGIGSSESHAWNLLKLDDGKYYYADSTWDDRGDDNGNYNQYFAKGSVTFGRDHRPFDPQMTYGTFLYTLPEVAAGDFDPNGNYRSTNSRLIDFDKSGGLTNRDIKTLQQLIVRSGSYVSYYDVNNDKKVNNRDLKELQRLITGAKA